MGQATNRKRRRNLRIKKRSLPKHPKLKLVNSIKDPNIKEIYDKNKSIEENLASMGLVYNSNSDIRTRKYIKDTKAITPKECPAFVGYAELQSHTFKGPKFDEMNPKSKKMSEFDQQYIKNLIIKHKMDFKKMKMDIATNYFQYSEKKLERLVNLFYSLNENERLVSIEDLGIN